MAMGHVERVECISHSAGRCYEIVSGKLKWGYDKGEKFEFVRGRKYSSITKGLDRRGDE